ncbi:MAG: SMC-Scp complex subunit ScpB [Candidatus Krumholzibacteriia bacterium]
MKRELEAVLFATEAPLAMPRLRAIFPDVPASQLRDTLAELQADYDQAGFAFAVVEFGGGWQVATRPDYAAVVQRLHGARRHVRLTKAGLEVLAIIAYRQPITRLEIEDIRGVQSSGALATLLERNLVTVAGRAETVGHPILYGTTREFLNHLGLKGLSQLPPLPEVESVMGNREEFRQFALQFGQELTDADLAGLEAEGADDEPPPAAPGEPGEALAPSDAETEPESGDDDDWSDDYDGSLGPAAGPEAPDTAPRASAPAEEGPDAGGRPDA